MGDNFFNKKTEQISKKFKKRILFALIPVIIPIVGALLVTILLVKNIDSVFQAIENTANAVDKYANFVTFNGWHTSADTFQMRLLEEYNAYNKYHNRKDELDIALIASTIHYDKLVDPAIWNGADPGEETGSYEGTDYFVPTSETRDFYRWARQQLGSTNAFRPDQRGLLGALISTKHETVCMPKRNIFEAITQDLQDKINQGIRALFTSVRTDLETKSIINSLYDLYANIKIEGIRNPIEFIEYVIDNSAGIAATYGYDIVNMIDYSGVDFNKECPEGEEPRTAYFFFNDYEKYKKYLYTYFIRQNIIECPKCQYKDYSEKQKNEKINEIIDEIFDRKQLHDYLSGKSKGEITNYIPGMASLPIKLEAGKSYNYTSFYGWRDLRGERNYHKGLDFGYPVGTPLYAMADGDVLFAGGNPMPGAGYGYYVKLGHDLNEDGKYDYYTLYAHLSSFNVVVGGKIGGGQKLGEVGNTGNSTGPHLHLEIRDSDDRTMDPFPIIEGMLKNGTSIFSKENGDD